MEKRTAKNRQSLAAEYGINRKIFREWLKKAKLVLSRGALTPKEVALVYETFGDPNITHNSPK